MESTCSSIPLANNPVVHESIWSKTQFNDVDMKNLTNDDIVSFAQYYRERTPLNDAQDNIPLLLTQLHSFITRCDQLSSDQLSSIDNKYHDPNDFKFSWEAYTSKQQALCFLKDLALPAAKVIQANEEIIQTNEKLIEINEKLIETNKKLIEINNKEIINISILFFITITVSLGYFALTQYT